MISPTPQTIFPWVLIVLDLCAAGVYGLYGDWIRTLYWIFAAGLTICVTLM